jgi:hypothetical protein
LAAVPSAQFRVRGQQRPAHFASEPHPPQRGRRQCTVYAARDSDPKILTGFSKSATIQLLYYHICVEAYTGRAVRQFSSAFDCVRRLVTHVHVSFTAVHGPSMTWASARIRKAWASQRFCFPFGWVAFGGISSSRGLLDEPTAENTVYCVLALHTAQYIVESVSERRRRCKFSWRH